MARIRPRSIPFHFLGLLACAASSASAAVTLPALWSEHAVIKRDAAARLWGSARPGATVRAELGGARGEAVAATDGQWRMQLDLSKVDDRPHDLTVGDGDSLVVRDILVGEVWVCSGQSNMEWALQATEHVTEDLAQSGDEGLRLLLVPKKNALTPQAEVAAHWVVAGPETAGTFPAVGYFFGHRLRRALHRPIGLIGASWSGTRIEPWIPADALVRDPELNTANTAILGLEQSFPTRFEAYADAYRAWTQRFDRTDRPYSVSEYVGAAAQAGWTPVKLPGKLSSQGFPAPGAIWLRHRLRVTKVGLPGIEAGAILYLPEVHGFDTVFWNGTEVGHTAFPTHAPEGGRRYVIPRGLLHDGEEVTLTVRVFSPGAAPAFAQRASNFAVGTNIFDPGEIRLGGDWEAKMEYTFPDRPGAAESYPKPPSQSETAFGRIYNALINPLTQASISGVVWYQGESNVDRAVQYGRAFPLLIESWRQHWAEGPFPFYFCQLANHGPRTNARPGESTWSELREVQNQTLRLPNTGEAVLIDLGVPSDEHPRNKSEVGERLARVALAHTYGQAVVDSGPTPQTIRPEGGTVRIAFAHTDGGLTIGRPGSPSTALHGFAVCGADRRWAWATARIEGRDVVVSAPQVPVPVAVRYGWSENPDCNLYNGEGLPASPFRSDDFPLTTLGRKFGG